MPIKIDPKKILVKAGESLTDAQKILWVIGRHAFFAVLILILLDLLFGGFLFFRYILLQETKTSKIDNTYFQFKEGAYHKVLDQWEARDKNLQESEEKNYPSPF